MASNEDLSKWDIWYSISTYSLNLVCLKCLEDIQLNCTLTQLDRIMSVVNSHECKESNDECDQTS